MSRRGPPLSLDLMDFTVENSILNFSQYCDFYIRFVDLPTAGEVAYKELERRLQPES